MKNTFKKLSALLLVLVMVLAMSANAFAAEGENPNMTGEDGVIGEFKQPDEAVEQGKNLVIYKEITAYNPESVTINAPTITYNYTIAPASVVDGTTVKDNASRHNQVNGQNVTATVAVKAGVGSPTITGTGAGVLAITPNDQLAASEYGTANRFELTVDFTSINWATTGTGAGVYRYEINETTEEATKNESGIAEGTTPKKLFLDVYVDGSGNIYGYVLFINNSSIDGSTSEATAASTAGKIEGFVDDADGHVYAGTDEDNSTADKYYTFNFDLTKVVVNDNYASTTKHPFPFTVTLDNPTVKAAVLPKMTVGTNATQTALTAGKIGTGNSATVWTPTIADGATLNYVGIPCGTTVTIYETNDVTGVTYNAVSTNADTNIATTIITGANSGNAIINCGATALTAATENHTAAGAGKVVTFTNTLLQISPTGIVMRVAPYVLILAAGVALLVLSRRRREDV